MSPRICSFVILALAALGSAVPCTSHAGATLSGTILGQNVLSELVTVRTEGSWLGEELVLEIHADIEASPLRSFGVTLSYDPNELMLTGAERNESHWYLGRPDARLPYAAPDVGRSGEVAILGGKLDVDDPSAGVAGPSVLLAELRFRPLGLAVPTLSVSRARREDFGNFVTVEGTVLDGSGIVFAPIGGSDVDLDGLPDFFDRCPLTPNPMGPSMPLNLDSGGVYSQADPAGATIDGIGDPCQCGDLEGDGRVNSADAERLRLHLADPSVPLSPTASERCAVIGSPETCNLLTWVILARAGQDRPPGVAQACGAATGVIAAGRRTEL